MKNKIEIKNNLVCKSYSSRMDFVKEESLYKKLKGTGLAPELLDSHDGYLEHEYVQGECFKDLLDGTKGDPLMQEYYYKCFCKWYEQYRELTKMTLGQLRLDKFIMTNQGLCYIDFESCKPGYLEDDLARMVAQIYVGPEPFSDESMDSARLFVNVAAKTITWIPELFSQSLSKAIISECKRKSQPVNEVKMNMLVTLLTSAGILFATSNNNLAECTKNLGVLPDMYLAIPKSLFNNSIQADGYKRVCAGSANGGRLQRLVEAQKNINQMWTIVVTSDMPRLPMKLIETMLAANKEEYAAVMVEAGGKIREFPLILNTAKTKHELWLSYEKGETSLSKALQSLPVNVIKVEEIR